MKGLESYQWLLSNHNTNSGSTSPIRFRIDLKTGIAMRAKKPFASAYDWCKNIA